MLKNFLIALILAVAIVAFAAISTEQRRSPDVIYLESGQKLVTVQYHDLQLIITTKEMKPEESPESYIVQTHPAYRRWRIIESK